MSGFLKKTQYEQLVRGWLLFNAVWVLLILVVGGLTRLTHSGLSMVDWRPLMGVIPPISQTDWEGVFALYRSSPEFQIVNYSMTLEEFKVIFYWEYVHRVLARGAALIFFIPYLYFLKLGVFYRRYSLQVLLAGILGGSQGVLGWYMVQSGLVNVPEVSHFRLAAHLSLALLIFLYLVWLSLKLKEKPSSEVQRKKLIWPSVLSVVLFFLVYLQIVYGAFVSGLKAGFRYNQWPNMGEGLVPVDSFLPELGWSDLTINPSTVQFIHRNIAYLIFVLIVGILWTEFKLSRRVPRLCWGLFLAVVVQASLGVLTLVFVVPTSLASLHQLGGVLVLLLSFLWLHRNSGLPT